RASFVSPALSFSCMSFFFQAEDGIGDFHVTGVQTCALPIFRRPVDPVGGLPLLDELAQPLTPGLPMGGLLGDPLGLGDDPLLDEIGRASCRERGRAPRRAAPPLTKRARSVPLAASCVWALTT